MDDVASHAAGIPAGPPANNLPLFPSDTQFVNLPQYSDLCQAVLDVVERERAHLNRNWVDVEAILWGESPNSLSRRFSRWQPDQRGRRMGERFRALIKHFAAFNSANRSVFETQVKRLEKEMEDQKATLAEKKRKLEARQDSNYRQESSLGACPTRTRQYGQHLSLARLCRSVHETRTT